MNECSHGMIRFEPTPDRPSVDSRPDITDGATTVSVNVTTSIGDWVETAVSTELRSQFGIEPSKLADHVLYCMPPDTISSIAYAYINSWLSVYNDPWCEFMSVQMHEVGHNLGLSHTSEGSDEYGDKSGMVRSW